MFTTNFSFKIGSFGSLLENWAGEKNQETGLIIKEFQSPPG
jgi:hypothetical protein